MLTRILLLGCLFLIGCVSPETSRPLLTADLPLHLEDHIDAATIVGSEVPADVPQPVEWRFDEPQPDWKAVIPWNPTIDPAQLTRTDDALRVTLTEGTRGPDGVPQGGIYINLSDWQREDWSYVLVRARTSGGVHTLSVHFNLRDGTGTATDSLDPFRFFGESLNVIHDGSVKTYLLRADWLYGRWEGPWQQLGLLFAADEPASIDLLSVDLIPKVANYTTAAVGMHTEVRNLAYRRTLYTHAPGGLKYRVLVPEAGRLDLGLGVLRDDAPVTFRITAQPEGGSAESLLEETYADKEHWAQRTVDLSNLAGQTVTLGFEADAKRAGTVALWSAPTLSGARTTDKPNVIFYIIDGGGADYMSVYGYNRRTTPTLERLASEGAVFERAYSNSTWTYPSTQSFMTSLQHSVLGGQSNWRDRVPEQAVTMAEHMHRAGYQTGGMVANPNAGLVSGLERGVDVFREAWEEFTLMGRQHTRESSRVLHEAFWKWREAYPAEPYWVHFQTVDVHGDFPAAAPFSGLFVGPDQLQTFSDWSERLRREGGYRIYSEAFEKTGISRVAFFTLFQGLYDETMAHNDYQLGRLVERLKAEGEWENTLLIVAADHSIMAAARGIDMGIATLDSPPPRWSHPIFRPSISRIPLLFVWPGHIAGGQRFSQPVSMVDALPTILDLAGLPMPEVTQGQSLAPLLLGREGFEARPVILDEFAVDLETGEFRGLIEVIDGRWGASLWIGPAQPPEEYRDIGPLGLLEQRPVHLLLYDLWNDPYCLHSVHEKHPDLVEKYTSLLEKQFEVHQALGQQFTRGQESPLTPEQLRTLRSLGYIR